jgi:hypothetical protein
MLHGLPLSDELKVDVYLSAFKSFISQLLFILWTELPPSEAKFILKRFCWSHKKNIFALLKAKNNRFPIIILLRIVVHMRRNSVYGIFPHW